MSNIEQKLSELLPGEEAMIIRVGCGAEIGKRLVDMGIVAGKKVLMRGSALFGDPFRIYIGYDLGLRKSEADYVIVTKIENEKNN